jgi:hypothetical protein
VEVANRHEALVLPQSIDGLHVHLGGKIAQRPSGRSANKFRSATGHGQQRRRRSSRSRTFFRVGRRRFTWRPVARASTRRHLELVSNLSAMPPCAASPTTTTPYSTIAADLGGCGGWRGGAGSRDEAALASHGRSHRFDPCHAHQHKRLLGSRCHAGCQQIASKPPTVVGAASPPLWVLSTSICTVDEDLAGAVVRWGSNPEPGCFAVKVATVNGLDLRC